MPVSLILANIDSADFSMVKICLITYFVCDAVGWVIKRSTYSQKILLQLPVIDFPFGYHFGTCS